MGLIVTDVCCNRCHGNAAKGFWDVGDNTYECVCCYNRCHGNVVQGFQTLWDMYEWVTAVDMEMPLKNCVPYGS